MSVNRRWRNIVKLYIAADGMPRQLFVLGRHVRVALVLHLLRLKVEHVLPHPLEREIGERRAVPVALQPTKVAKELVGVPGDRAL